MGYNQDSRRRLSAEENVIAAIELRDKILFGGGEGSAEFYLSFLGGSHCLVRHRTSKSLRQRSGN